MYFLFDIGGTNIRLALVNNPADKINLDEVEKIETPKSFEALGVLIKSFLESKDALGKIERSIGGTTGVLDTERSTMLNAVHLPEWNNKNLKLELEKITQSSVVLVNDSALATLGEATFGVGSSYKIVSYVTVSTGVGGGRVINKKIDSSSLNFEIGHQIINFDGEPKYLEDLVSGSAIEKRIGKKPEEITDITIWTEVEKLLAVGLNNLLVHWSPDVVVIGGAVGKSLNIEHVELELKRLMRIYPIIPPILKSDLRHNVIHGALYLLRESLNE